MGTRGLIGFVIKGRRRATYNHFDSYPEGLGFDVLRFILSLDEEGIKEMQALLIWLDQEDDTEELSNQMAKALYGTQNLSGAAPLLTHAPAHKAIVESSFNRDHPASNPRGSAARH